MYYICGWIKRTDYLVAARLLGDRLPSYSLES